MEEFKTLLVDFELKQGERFKLEEAIPYENISLVYEIVELEASESITDSLVSKDDDQCELCNIAKDQNSQHHKC